MHRKIYRGVYIALGFICLGVGAIGVVLPVLPTTPFLLLASFFLARGSTKFHNWLVETKLYKNHLHEFVQTRSMTLKTKWCILLPASFMLILAFIFSPIWHAQVLIVFAFLFKYYYFFFRIRTIKEESA
ncbi:MAG: YbaN family protein [Coprobacillaceae bacterium]